jgi:hypothetical protein
MYLSELIRLEQSLLQKFTEHEVTILYRTYTYFPDTEEPDPFTGSNVAFFFSKIQRRRELGREKLILNPTV